MYKLSIEQLEALADRLQIKERAPNYEIRVYRKSGNGAYENLPNRIKVERIDIDSRWNMAADEASVTIDNVDGTYSPDYSHLKTYRGIPAPLPMSPYHDVLLPFNRIEIDLGYGNELVRKYTGQLQPVQINDKDQTITIDCKNEFRKLLKPIDTIDTRQIIYEGKRATEVIVDLLTRAGVENMLIDVAEIGDQDFNIQKFIVELGTTYKDAINKILEIMGHRIFANRQGFVEVKQLELYKQSDFHNWEFSDYINLTQGGYDIDPSILRNRIIIQGENEWKAFEDPLLIDYCNGERIPMGIEVPWANTSEQMQYAADNYFVQMRRKLRRLTVGVIGNPCMDIGDLVKMEMFISTAVSKYMIVGISSSFSESGYIDTVDVEFVTEGNHVAVEAEGEYKTTKLIIDENGEHEEDLPDSNQGNEEVDIRTKLLQTAKKWLDTPYQWGGCIYENQNDYGFDCSHFIYAVLQENGLIDRYKTAEGLRQWTSPITKEELQPGDLLFYLNSNGKAIHVTMFVENNKAIGASGGDSMTTTGAKARQRNAKVKISNAFYGTMEYGRVTGV